VKLHLIAVQAMRDLMERVHALTDRDALALASAVVDLRVTQIVNGVNGVHARLPHNAIRFPT
jgi:acetamidase/formamidase